ncbi:MAG: DUF4249 domain-containing protein [Sphingobacteriales bacterium]|nr:MAG: DUF4249 domain-containing protein [Sphingobacteriales bacterium]
MKKILFILLLANVLSCKDDYNLPVSIPATGYLVIDGSINSGIGETVIALSKTVRLTDSFNVNYVTNAAVTLEGQDNSKIQLNHRGNGQYVHNQLALNRSQQYRLRILENGKEYVSGYLPVRQSPVIDSISWEYDQSGVHIFMDAKGNTNTSGYYRYEYAETWEFHAAYAPNLKYDLAPSAVYIERNQNSDYSKFTCYQGSRSTSIEILSTAKIARDTTHYRLLTVPRRDWRISVLYSVEATQTAISKEGFEYLSKMKRNTEQSGSIFDAQPSELRGNITCVTNPAEPVIGFLEIADVYKKRIFIKNSQVPGWAFAHDCVLQNLVNKPDSIKNAGMPPPVMPATTDQLNNILYFYYTQLSCVDCSQRGTLTKPSFWP